MLFDVLTSRGEAGGELNGPSEARRKRGRPGISFYFWLWLNPLANASLAFLRGFLLLLTMNLHSVALTDIVEEIFADKLI